MFSIERNITIYCFPFPKQFWCVLLQINVTPKRKELEILDWTQIEENKKSFNNLTDKLFLSFIKPAKC